MRNRKYTALLSLTLCVLLLAGCGGAGAPAQTAAAPVQSAEAAEIPDTEAPEPVEAKLALISENGQMNVLKKGADSLIITMNAIGGDVLVLDACVKDNDLEISEFSRIVKVEDGSRSISLNCTASGSGKKYDEIIILEFSYLGEGSSTLYDYSIKSSSVKCVAKLNR